MEAFIQRQQQKHKRKLKREKNIDRDPKKRYRGLGSKQNNNKTVS